jgi:hypothetical protein
LNCIIVAMEMALCLANQRLDVFPVPNVLFARVHAYKVSLAFISIQKFFVEPKTYIFALPKGILSKTGV